MEKMDNYMETGFLQELIWIMECRGLNNHRYILRFI